MKRKPTAVEALKKLDFRALELEEPKKDVLEEILRIKRVDYQKLALKKPAAGAEKLDAPDTSANIKKMSGRRKVHRIAQIWELLGDSLAKKGGCSSAKKTAAYKKFARSFPP